MLSLALSTNDRMSVLRYEKQTWAEVLNNASTKSPAPDPKVLSGTVTSKIVVYDGNVN
jgi:hypothetical protein